ncbi:MAG TPA: Ig-like domain-containing protein, partial [Gaiellaceae bacterium]|nr:Ig-like domain-containing protein [Gaiellaceae bacterium]
MPQLLRAAVIACVLFLALPSLVLAGVQPGQPFPTNLDTKLDLTQLTLLRVALPKPDCTTHPSDCADIDVLNTLDGFSVDARVSIPFSGPIDLTTVTPDTVFLVDPQGRRTPLDRLVWTPATNTLHGVPRTYLSQHTPYALVVTDGVKAADGSALDSSIFREGLEIGRSHDLGSTLYRLALLGAL